MEVYSCIESREVFYHNHQQIDYDPAALSGDEDITLFSAGSYGSTLAREGGLEQQDAAIVRVRGFEARADGPELTNQHELMLRLGHTMPRAPRVPQWGLVGRRCVPAGARRRQAGVSCHRAIMLN
jgi:hypothetical protein